MPNAVLATSPFRTQSAAIEAPASLIVGRHIYSPLELKLVNALHRLGGNYAEASLFNFDAVAARVARSRTELTAQREDLAELLQDYVRQGWLTVFGRYYFLTDAGRRHGVRVSRLLQRRTAAIG